MQLVSGRRQLRIGRYRRGEYKWLPNSFKGSDSLTTCTVVGKLQAMQWVQSRKMKMS